VNEIIAMFKDRGLEIFIAALAGYNVVAGLAKRETRFFALGRLPYREKPTLYVISMLIYAAVFAWFAWLIYTSFSSMPRGPLGPQV
jgi:hypothetical protein